MRMILLFITILLLYILFSTLFPRAKYIVSVRDPIDQVRSHFYYQLVNISTPKSNELHSYLERQLQAYWACVNDTGDSLWCVHVQLALLEVSGNT